MRWLVPSLACLALAAGEPLTATPWDVRKEAGELFEELGRGGEQADLLVRARELIFAHGDDLVTTAPNEAAPISRALAARLAAAGLSERFAAEIAPTADRRLAALIAAGEADAATWAGLARTAPGTEAAKRAWRQAADLAWDNGLLRLYRDAAASAGDADLPGRKQRWAAADTLLTTPPPLLPGSLDGLETMWRIGLERTPLQTLSPGRRRLRQNASVQRPGASTCGDGAIAVADGQSLLVIDHLVGAALGARLALGTRPLPSHIARPAPVAGGTVAIGLADGRLLAVCVDAAGTERWRQTGNMDSIDAVGAPVSVDALVTVPYRAAGEDRLELRVLALSARDGHVVWDTAVCQLAAAGWGGGDGISPPSIARHARGLVVCSNAGIFALLGSDGKVARLWTYPTRPELEIDGARRGRRGLAASDGTTAVATPADHAGLVLVLGPDDQNPRAYRGDGADGDVLAVEAGDALLAGRQVALIDTVRLRLRWNAPLRLAEPQGLLSHDGALVAGLDQLALLGRSDGIMRSWRAIGEPAAMTVGDGVLVLADSEAVRGFGNAAAFLGRLREAAAAAGSDPRPHAALGAVLAGRGDSEAALAAWHKALALGAGPAIAERMARLLRTRLIQAVEPAVASTALDQLAALGPHLPGAADEVRLWRARLAETAGDRARAAGLYAATATADDRLLPLPEGISVSLRMLAEAGLARTGGTAWSLLAAPVAAASAPPGTWTVAARVRGRAVIADGLVCAFADGLLRAWQLSDGHEAWSRKPQRALLGVQAFRQPAADGVAIQVLPGSAGDAAGLRDGDVLLTLNGEILRDFDGDLRPRVLALGGGAPFTFRVRGSDGVERTVTGSLGGEPVEPIASDGDIVLARTTMALDPRRTDLRVFAVDAKTGADLWAHALSHDEDRLARTIPVLAGGVAVAADGPDLVGIARDGTVRWRLAGRADLLAQATTLGRCLWLPTATGEGVLLDPVDGRELARVPADSEELPVLGASTLAVRGPDKRIAVWDLATGRLRSRSTDPARAVALRSDSLLALDQRAHPVVLDAQSGAVRRVLADAPVELSAIGGGIAVLALAGAEHRSLAAIDLDGLVQRWTLQLPPGLEVEALRPAADGLVAILREGTRTWGLSINGRGQPTAVAGWNSDPGGDASPLGSAMLVIEDRSLRVQPPGLPDPPAALRCTTLDPARPLRQSATDGLIWSQPDGAALAVARHGIHLVVAVRCAGDEHVLRLADAGGTTSLDAVRAMVAPGGLRLAIPGSWTLAEQWTSAGSDGPVVWSAWAPSPSRAPGSPLAVQLDGHAGLPWWLAAGWRRVLDAP